jgi:hypothetical protein
MNNAGSVQLQNRNKSTLLLFGRHNPAQWLIVDRRTHPLGQQAFSLLSIFFQERRLS